MAYSAWSVTFGEQPSAAKWNILGTNDASFNDGTGIAASAITPEKLLTGTGTSWTYTSYSPTLTNLTVGNGTMVAYYKQVGKLVHYWGNFTLGSTSTVGTNPQITVPVTINSSAIIANENFEYGQAHYQDTGVAAYNGLVRADSTTAFTFTAYNSSATYLSHATVTATTPFTFGTNDKIQWNSVYPAA